MKSEARNRALLQAMPDLMFRLNRQGVILDYHARDDIQLYRPPSEFLGRNVTEVHAELGPRILACVRDTLETGVMKSMEYRMAIGDQVSDFEARFVRSSEDEVLSVIREITEQKRLDRALLDTSNREQQRIGHDLHDGLSQQLTENRAALPRASSAARSQGDGGGGGSGAYRGPRRGSHRSDTKSRARPGSRRARRGWTISGLGGACRERGEPALDSMRLPRRVRADHRQPGSGHSHLSHRSRGRHERLETRYPLEDLDRADTSQRNADTVCRGQRERPVSGPNESIGHGVSHHEVPGAHARRDPRHSSDPQRRNDCYVSMPFDRDYLILRRHIRGWR